MDDEICVLPLQLTLLLHKDNNGDDIKDDYGQTFDDEDHKPWNALWSCGERLHFLWALLTAIKITENSWIRDKMKYKFNILNKEICQLLLFIFFNVLWPTKFRLLTKTDPLVSLCDIHIRKVNHSAYSVFFPFEKDEYNNIELFRYSLNNRKALPLVI